VTDWGVDQLAAVKVSGPLELEMSGSPLRSTSTTTSSEGRCDSTTVKVPPPPSGIDRVAADSCSCSWLSSRVCTLTVWVVRPLACTVRAATSSLASRSRRAAMVTGWGRFQLALVKVKVAPDGTPTSASPEERAVVTVTVSVGAAASRTLKIAG
jgi:hypothetical protein